MSIERVNLKEQLYQVRLSFDTQLAEVLQRRPDLTQARIKQEFGVSDSVIRRVMKQFNVSPRRGGRKLSSDAQTAASTALSSAAFDQRCR
jgi:hypothetical protein